MLRRHRAVSHIDPGWKVPLGGLDLLRRASAEDLYSYVAATLAIQRPRTLTQRKGRNNPSHFQKTVLKIPKNRAMRVTEAGVVPFHFGTRVPFRHCSTDRTFQNEIETGG